MKLLWVFRAAAGSGEPRTAWGGPGGLCWIRLHREGQGQTRVCPEIVASWAIENVPNLEEDLSFYKFLKVREKREPNQKIHPNVSSIRNQKPALFTTKKSKPLEEMELIHVYPNPKSRISTPNLSSSSHSINQVVPETSVNVSRVF